MNDKIKDIAERIRAEMLAGLTTRIWLRCECGAGSFMSNMRVREDDIPVSLHHRFQY
jgi:hypothetical protein